MAQSTISQRIALEGAEDIQRQLADLGKTGESAIKQIQDATAGAGPGLSTLSTISATVSAAFGRVGEALAPVRESFTALGEAAAVVGERITKVSEIFGIGLAAGIAGGVAGIAELVKGTLESSHQLEVQASVLGVTVEQLQVYRAAATQAGVSADTVYTALARLAQNVGKEHEKLNEDAIKALNLLIPATQQVGTAVVQGIMPIGTAIKTHIISNIQDTIPQINEFIALLQRAASDQGTPLAASTIEQIRQKLINLGGDASKTATQIREIAASLGVNFPAVTELERLNTAANSAKDPLLAVGVTFKDLIDAGDNFDPIIRKIIDGLGKIEDPTRRGQVGLALLGRGWKEIIPAFDGGSAALDRVRDRLEASGLLLGKEQVEAGSQAEKAYVSLGGAAKRLSDQLVLIFAPSITDAAIAFRKLIVDNADTLKSWAEAINAAVVPAIKGLFEQLGLTAPAVKKVGDEAKNLPDVLTGKGGSGVVQTGAVAPKLVGIQPGETPISVGVDTSRLDTARTKVAQLASDIKTVPAIPAEVFGPPAPVENQVSAIKRIGAQLEELSKKWEGLKNTISGAFAAIGFVLTPVTFVINTLFGTEFSNSATAALLILGKISGVFGLLQRVSELVLVAIGTLARGILTVAPSLIAFFATPAGLAVGAVAGLALLIGGIILFRDRITQALSDVQKALGDFLQANVGDQINALFKNISFEPFRLAVISALNDARMALDGFLQSVADFFEITLPAKVAAGVKAALDAIKSLASSVGQLLGLGGGGGGQTISPSDSPGLGVDSGGGDFSSAMAASAPGIATGGHITNGPSGIDRIPAMLSLNEFVIRAEAVRHYGANLFHAFNSMSLPIRGFNLGGIVDAIGERFAPMPLMLAGGGPVLSASGGPMNSLTLHLDGHSFSMAVKPGEVFDKLSRHARSSAIRSAGRKPSWAT